VIGRQLGPYRIVEALGSGGMGDVYVAEDSRLGRRVALKVLPESMAADPERRMRFEREARAVAKLSHPNIVMLHSVEEADGLHFFTMELVTGKTLSQLLDDRSGLPPLELGRLATQLVEAVAAAHRAGVTHRDLKPANVMVTEDGRVKVLDFGLAKLAEPGPEEAADETVMLADQKTELGRVVGTLAYMSPEQAEGKPVDARSDVFALGILLHQMATGESPFSGESRLSLVSSILKDVPRPLSEARPQLGERVSSIVTRCLEKNPDDRYPSAVELLADLEGYRRELETSELLSGTHSDLSSRTAPVVTGRGGRTRPWKTAAAVFVVIALAVAIWLALDVPSRPDRDQVATGGERNTLAVFYFENLTGDPEVEWLRTGLTDMLVTDLSQSPDLRVMGTDRLHQILVDMGRETDPKVSPEVVEAVAREGAAGTAILGSYAKAGEALRISVRIQDVRDGELLASEKVEGPTDAVFAMVDDMTRRIRDRLAIAEGEGSTIDRNLASVTTESVEAYRAYAEGLRFHETGDEEKAIPQLERAVALDPGFAMALAKLSVAYGNSNQPEKSKEYGARALELVDRMTARERYYIEGVYYSKDPETIDRAAESYRKAVELFPDHNSARNNLAQIYYRQGEFEQAILHLERLRRDGMVFPGTFNLLANAYLATERPEEAIDVLEQYVAEHPDNPTGHRNLANVQLSTGQYPAALASLEKVEELAPGSAMDDLWAAYVLTERWDDARRAARAVQTGPVAPMRWVGYAMEGIGELYRGRRDAGIKLLRAGIEVVPDPAQEMDIRKIDAIFSSRLGREVEALERAESLLETTEDPEHVRDLSFVAAIAELKLGRQPEAESYLARALATIDGEDEEAQRTRHYLRGMFALEQGRNDAAIRELLAAEPYLPDVAQQSLEHADVWGGLGRAYLAEGDPAEAAVWFETLIDSGTSRLIMPAAYVRSHFLLAECRKALGDPSNARKHYAKFLEYWGEGELDRDRVEQARSRLAELAGSR
jgi:tetratricopeptide (TPR) repeat protein